MSWDDLSDEERQGEKEIGKRLGRENGGELG